MDFVSRAANIAALAVAALALSACSVPKGTLFYGTLAKGESAIIVANGAATGAQNIVAYDTSGKLLEVLVDTTYDALIPRGLATVDPFRFMIAFSSGADQLAYGNTGGGYTTFVTNSNLAGQLYQMARHELSKTFWVLEGTNNIEAFDATGARLGSGANPAIVSTFTNGTCAAMGTPVVLNPRGVTVDQERNKLIVAMNSGTLGVVHYYDISNIAAITCTRGTITSSPTTPLPGPVILHSNGWVYVATQAVTQTGLWALPRTVANTAAVNVLMDTTRVVLNVPTALLELPDGTVLVANEGTDQIDRYTMNGSSAALRVGTTPFIKDAFTAFVNQMLLIKGM